MHRQGMRSGAVCGQRIASLTLPSPRWTEWKRTRMPAISRRKPSEVPCRWAVKCAISMHPAGLHRILVGRPTIEGHDASSPACSMSL